MQLKQKTPPAALPTSHSAGKLRIFGQDLLVLHNIPDVLYRNVHVPVPATEVLGTTGDEQWG